MDVKADEQTKLVVKLLAQLKTLLMTFVVDDTF